MNAQVQLNRKNQTPNMFEELMQASNYFYDRILRAIFIGVLFMLDFVMFIYSINGRIIEDGAVNMAAVYIVGGFFVVALVIMFLLSFSGLAQNVFCALFVLLTTIVFLDQFALFNVDTFIETWLNEHASFLSFIGFIPSVWLVGLFLAVIVFFCFRYTPMIFVTVLALAGSLGFGMYRTEMMQIPEDEYVEINSVDRLTGDMQQHNLVYIMAPKFPSYHFLSTIKDVNFRELRDLMVGFYAVNGFEIYPNAFVQKSDTVSNIVDIYNQVNYASTTSGIRGYAEILNDWDFAHYSLDTMALEDNKLYERLNKDGYRISTYSMPQFNLCYKNGQLVSDRCVVKQSRPVKLYDKKSSLEKNIYALLGEWVVSLKSPSLKPIAKMLIDGSSLKGYKILSDNRRSSVEGASNALMKAYEDFDKDGKGVAYMSFVELPSDLYVYDEFCNLKPRNKWVALKDSMIYSGGIDEKRRAYVEQTKCLIGLLQMYMEGLYQNKKLAQTDIIIQGVSPLRELAGMPAGQYGTFVADRLVSMGIRRGERPNFLINTEICLASDISRSLINNEKECYTIDHMKMSTEDAHNLKQNLVNNSVIRGSKISNIAAGYRDWYEEFRRKSPQYQTMLKDRLKVEAKAPVVVEEVAPVAVPQVKDEVREEALPEVRKEEAVEVSEQPVENVVLEVREEVAPAVVDATVPEVEPFSVEKIEPTVDENAEISE